ncbi:MAG: hypothetical protein ACI9G1_002510, partial [Pirellulaceae bacterium]
MSRIQQLLFLQPAMFASCALLILVATSAAEDEAIFSGPQVGEKMAAFTMKGAIGDQVGQNIDLLKKADGQPTVLIFVHKRTRPAFGLTNTVMKMVASRNHGKDKPVVTAGVCFLTDDATETETWMKRIPNYFPKGATFGISNDGLEGLGAYGLNRNVTLTVLVAKDNKVTANFALVQPSMQSDGPKIFKAVIDALGGGEVPPLAQFTRPARQPNPNQRPARKGAEDPSLIPLLRQLIQKTNSKEDVEKAANAIEKHLIDNELGQRHIHRVSNTIINGGKLENYGTAIAQSFLKKWATEYAQTDTDAKQGNAKQ